jgi:hypothetical protein
LRFGESHRGGLKRPGSIGHRGVKKGAEGLRQKRKSKRKFQEMEIGLRGVNLAEKAGLFQLLPGICEIVPSQGKKIRSGRGRIRAERF